MSKKCFVILLAIFFISCRKEDDSKNLPAVMEISDPLPAAVPITLTVKVDQSKPAFPVPPLFEGLSFETRVLIEDPEFLSKNNAVFIQLIKNLGKGVLRIGGNSSDELDWADSAAVDETTKKVLIRADIDRLAAFSKAISWPVLFNLNLGNNNAAAAAKEALYVNNKLGSSLTALQIGNEPDAFIYRKHRKSYKYADFLAEWKNYFKIIRAKVPQARFAGPDVDPFNADWVNNFAKDQGKNIKLIDAHYYNTGPASDPAITYQNILKPNTKLDGFLIQMGKISAQYRLPYRISECNNVWDGGKPGVSDTHASALWALDFMWRVLENKGSGVNFHGGPSRFAYSPITMLDGDVVARPEYYAMLAFNYATTGGSVVRASITDPVATNNCSTYACKGPDNDYFITLINKEEAKTFSFSIQLDNTATAIYVSRLTAPSITATRGITFQKSTVNTDGTFTPTPPTQHLINAKTFVITVPSGSAVVVRVK
jgi:hypothetical protein